MATYDVSGVDSSKGRPNIPAKTVVFLRCVGIEKKLSKAGNDMLVFQWEIAAPEQIQIKGTPTPIAGLQLTDWVVLNNDRGLIKLKELVKACDSETSIDVEDATVLKRNFLGKAIRALIRTETTDKMYNTEAVDEKTGEPIQAPVLDDDGNKMTDFNYKLMTIVGRSSEYTIPSDAAAF